MATRPTEKTIKRLFAVSGNRCTFPGCPATLVTGNTVTGEICHIKAQSPNGPRYDPDQSDKERHGFDNLLLLCGDHHKVIDDKANLETYTVERLGEIKAQHEKQSVGGVELTDETARQMATLLENQRDIGGMTVIENNIVTQRVGTVKDKGGIAGVLGAHGQVGGERQYIITVTVGVERFFARLWDWLASRYVYLNGRLCQRYLQAYCTNLATEFRTLDLLGRRPLKLEEIYIALRLSDHAPPDLLPDPARDDVGAQGEDLRRAQRHEKAMEVEEALGLSPRLVVLGDPGAGKTTLLKHLVLRVAQGDPELAEVIAKTDGARLDAPRIPFFVTLNDLAREGHTLVEGMVASLNRRGFPHARLFVQRALARGRCLCLLDGLDEVVDEETHTRLVREINELSVARPENRFLVTSRIAGFRYRFEGGFRLLEVAEFDREQVHRFVESWFADDSEKAEGLQTALDASPRMRLLAVNPLLLSIIALIYELDTRLPERRVELYKRCVWVLNEEWVQRKRREGQRLEKQRSFTPDFTLQALEALALRFQQGNHLVIESEDLVTHLKDILPDPDQAGDFLDEVLALTGLLRQMSRTSYAFTHLTIQEFLAAQAIKTAGDLSLAVEHLDEPWWRETIILLAGLQRDAAELIRSILAVQPESLETLLLAVCCLTDADSTAESLRAEVVGRLVTWLKTTDDYRLVRGVEDLADALDEAAWTALTGLLRDPDPVVRVRIAGLLGALSTERSVRALIEAVLRDGDLDARASAGSGIVLWLQEPAEPAALRVEAIKALGQMPFEVALKVLDKAACRFLAGCLTDDDAEIRRSASEALRFAFVHIPAGEFLMGSDKTRDPEAGDDEFPQHPVTLPDYTIARYPVTEAQYARFVAATERQPPEHWQEGQLPDGKEGHPVVNVTWHDAVAYCEWLAQETGRPIRLPTEAEWEKAARGTDGRIYPWGDEFDKNKCNSSESGMGIGTTTPVGKYSPAGDSPYGCADVAGNVGEWTGSLKKDYPYQADDGREDPDGEARRVLRGGSFYVGGSGYSRCAARHWYLSPVGVSWYLGFRVGVVAAPFSRPARSEA